MSTGWWAGTGLGPKAYKRTPKWQHQYPRGRTSSPNGCHQCLCPQSKLQLLLPFWKNLQDQQVGLTRALIKLLLLSWVLDHVRFCVCPIRVEPISHSSLGLPRLSPAGLQSQMFWGLLFLVPDPQTGELDVGLRLLGSWGEPLRL